MLPGLPWLKIGRWKLPASDMQNLTTSIRKVGPHSANAIQVMLDGLRNLCYDWLCLARMYGVQLPYQHLLVLAVWGILRPGCAVMLVGSSGLIC